MTKKPIVVYTTVYPEAMQFLPTFVQSLKDQTDGEYDLFIGLDRLEKTKVDCFFNTITDCVYLKKYLDESPASLRQRAIVAMIHQYPAVIFVDSDDILTPIRVEAARKMLKSADVGGCAMSIINEKGEPLEKQFQYPTNAILASQIPLCYNVYGLSNTIYSSDILKKILPIPEDCILVDWFLATSAWIHGARFSFDPVPRMLYRQYSMNTARILPPFSPDYILKATRLVVDHYLLVLTSIPEIPTFYKNQLEEQKQRVSLFLTSMKQNPEKLQLYVQRLNILPNDHIWWDMVAHPDLDRIWIKSM